MKKLQMLGASALGLGMSPVFAAAVDVTDVVTDIGAQMASVTAVAGAVLLIHFGIKAFKWIRRAG